MGHNLTSLFLTAILIGSSISLTSALTCENCISIDGSKCQSFDKVPLHSDTFSIFKGDNMLDLTIVEHPEACVKTTMKLKLPNGRESLFVGRQGSKKNWKNRALDDSCHLVEPTSDYLKLYVQEMTICSCTKNLCYGQSIVKPIHLLLILPLITFFSKFSFL